MKLQNKLNRGHILFSQSNVEKMRASFSSRSPVNTMLTTSLNRFFENHNIKDRPNLSHRLFLIIARESLVKM